MLFTDSLNHISLADSNSSTSDNTDIISIEEKGTIDQKVQWHVEINKPGTKLSDKTIRLKLEGGHELNVAELNSLLVEKKIIVTQPDPAVKDYILSLEEVSKPISFDFSTIITDDNNSNYKMTLATTAAEQTIKASDTFYQKTEISGELTYKDVPSKTTPQDTTIYLIDKNTDTIVKQQTLTPTDETYFFKDIRKLNDNNELIQYEVKTEPLGTYKTTVTDYNIEQTYLSTKIEGTVKNESNKPLTVQAVNQATDEVMDAIEVAADAESYTIADLPLNNEEGQNIDYAIKVENIEGYKTDVTDNNIEVTKSEDPTTEEPTTEQPTSEGATTEDPTTENPSSEDINTEEPTTENPTTEAPSTAEPDPVEQSIVYTAPKTRSFSTMSMTSAPSLAAASTNYSANDYTYTSNVYTAGSSFKGTLSGVMAADQSKIDWTFVFSNYTGYNYDSSLKNITASSNLQYPTTMSATNGSYSATVNVTKGTSSAYTSIFYTDSTNTTVKFSTPITTLNQSSYSFTLGTISSSGTDYVMNLTGTFTLKEKSATPTVNSVSIADTTVTGKAVPGATVKVMSGTTQIGTGVADSSGNYSVTIPKQSAGTVLTVTATESGKRQSDSTTVTVSDKIPISIAKVYSDQTAVVGTAEPFSRVTITNSMGTVLGSTQTSADGTYYVEMFRPLAAGTVITGTAISVSGTQTTATTTVLAADTSGTPGTGKTIVEPSPTYKGAITDMSWDERGLYRNRVPQPVEYNESFQWKAAQPTETANEYAIDLKTQGRASVSQDPLDIVLVLDNSGSMSDLGSNGQSRWTNMKTSVNSFIDEVTKGNSTKAAADRTRIGIVNYASEIISKQTFADNATTIKAGIPVNNQTGSLAGTFTQLGIREGATMLATSPKKNKIMIVLTDGAPTYSYLGTSATGPEDIKTFDYSLNNRKGNGAEYRLYAGYTEPYISRSYTLNSYLIDDHGQPTISEAKLIKASNPSFEIFSIGIDTNTATSTSGVYPGDVDNVITKIASKPANAYVTNDSAKELPQVLANISQNISNSVASGIVTDPIGTMYDLNLGSNNTFDASDYTLTASNPELLNGVTATYDAATRTIKLNGLTLGKGEWVNINYKVKLRTTDPSFVDNQWYAMNGKTTLNTTATGSVIHEYPVPEARATSPVYDFIFNKLDNSNNPLAGAVFELKDSAGSVISQTSTSSGLVSFDKLKKGTYTLTETSAPAGYSKDAAVYTVVIASDGKITVNGTVYTGTNMFKVINTKILGRIDVLKHQSGDESKGLAGAAFVLKDSTGKVIATQTTPASGIISFTNLNLGNYTLTETKAPSGYRLNQTPINVTVKDGTTVTIKVPNASNTAILPNTGGMGTILFTVIGIVLIALALWFKRRRN